MVLISPNFALIIFSTIILVSVGVAWYMGTHSSYDQSSFRIFVAIISGLGVFITFMFYYNVVGLQQQQQELAFIQEMERFSDSILSSMLESLNSSSILIPNFVMQLTPLTNTMCLNNYNIPDPVTPQTCTEKMTLSYRIFSLWQDTLISKPFLRYDPKTYVSNYLQRANSKQLYKLWEVSKLNFSPETQSFGDLLFQYALPITIQTPEEYEKAAYNLINDPLFNQIM